MDSGTSDTGAEERRHIEELEGIVEKIYRADAWMWRLRDFWNELSDNTAKRAFERLVRLGCVPDVLASFWYEINRPITIGSDLDPTVVRRNDAVCRRQLKRLVRIHEKLARVLDAYVAQAAGLRTSRRWEGIVDERASEWLRNQADYFKSHLSVGAKEKLELTPKEYALHVLLWHVTLVTGSYQDKLVVDLSVGTRTHLTVEGIRQWRARVWRNHRWLGRSRIDWFSRRPDYPRLVAAASAVSNVRETAS